MSSNILDDIRGSGYLSPSRSGPEKALSLFYCFLQNHCDVLHYIMYKVTFTSPLTFHIVCLFVCLSVRNRMFGHFNIVSCPNMQYKIYTGTVTPKITGKAHENRRPTSVRNTGPYTRSLYRSVTPKITGKVHVNRRPTSVFRHGSSRPLYRYTKVVLLLK